MKTGSPPPHERINSPFAEKRCIQFWPYPSETTMSPFGASTAAVGMLNGLPGAARLARRPERQQHLAGRRMLRDRVQARIGDEHLVARG